MPGRLVALLGAWGRLSPAASTQIHRQRAQRARSGEVQAREKEHGFSWALRCRGVLGAPGATGYGGAPVALAVCMGWEGADVPHGTGKCRGSPRAALGRAEPAVRQVAGTCPGDGAGVSPPP